MTNWSNLANCRFFPRAGITDKQKLDYTMSRICELTGKTRLVGNNVSHAKNRTKKTFLPNLQNVTLISDTLEKGVKLRVSTHGLRSVEHVGGLDNWLLKTKDDKLSLKARRLKKEVAKKQAMKSCLTTKSKQTGHTTSA